MLFERGVLINFAGNAVLRFIPPLIVSRGQIDRLGRVLDEVFSSLA
jgi:acetylornithine aminotransferase/acetylornithine/N-succinyldiaminopimelate aminotransferase